MKDGRTHLAHKAEHAVDLDTASVDIGALVAVTLQGADVGDTSSLVEPAIKAAASARARQKSVSRCSSTPFGRSQAACCALRNTDRLSRRPSRPSFQHADVRDFHHGLLYHRS